MSEALRRLGRPTGAFDAARYFRGDHGLRFHNVGSAQVRSLARAIHTANHAAWTVDHAMRLADELMHDPFLETKAVGVEVLARYRRAFTPRLLPAWKRWLAGNLAANWATTDLVCGRLIGPLVVDRPSLAGEIQTWATHHNMWVRRASAVSLIPAIRRGLVLDTAYDVARTLHPDPEDLVQKAVGWMLRDAGKRDPARLERYLRAGGATIPRTTLRYAIERFPASERKALLLATRQPRGRRRRPPRQTARPGVNGRDG
ncbi:MAG TPA: DNA alkylation repair protein [Methylomirabilota bacterium]